jgi:hypothetical protein
VSVVIAGQTCHRGMYIRRRGLPGWGLGVGLATLSCKKEFVENLLEKAKAHL